MIFLLRSTALGLSTNPNSSAPLCYPYSNKSLVLLLESTDPRPLAAPPLPQESLSLPMGFEGMAIITPSPIPTSSTPLAKGQPQVYPNALRPALLVRTWAAENRTP